MTADIPVRKEGVCEESKWWQDESYAVDLSANFTELDEEYVIYWGCCLRLENDLVPQATMGVQSEFRAHPRQR